MFTIGAPVHWFLVISASICLCGLLLASFHSLLADTLARRKILRSQQSDRGTESSALSNRLRRTYFDLSMSRREISWREVYVAKIDRESEDVRSFYLVDKNHEPLPSFLAGQHLLVERPESKNGAKDCRCYSLSDECATGYWRISVKQSSGHPQSISRWLHEEIRVGDSLRVRGPTGAFYFRTDRSRSVVLASAGIGLTPMLPMLQEAIRTRIENIRVFAQFRDVQHMPFADSLIQLAKQHSNVQMNLWISRFPKGVRSSEGSAIYEGKFTASQLLEYQDAISNTDYYLCGPEPWQSRLRKDLVDAGVSESAVEYELFQPSELASPPTEINTVCNVHFRQSGATARFENNHPNLLGCASKNQVPLESGCRTGACGSCVVKLIQGKVRYTRSPQYTVKKDEILPCVCVPETDLILDA
jgi:uncharacterized protein